MITLVENEEIISGDLELTKTFQFFSSIVKNLDMQRDETHLSNTTQDNPVIACIEKFSKNPSKVSIKKRMETTSNKFSFKYEERKKFLTEIQNLNSRKASQQNDIPVKILSKNSDIFSYILHHNFNNSLFSNKFPKYLKKADKTLVFKKDGKCLKTNYRSVRILPTVSKIYERCLYDQINDYFQPLFLKLQYGFRKGHSAQHCPLVLIEKFRKALDKRDFPGFHLTDLPKAFNCIDHELLIAKCHVLVNTTGTIRISVRNETISNSSNQKLLCIRFYSNFRFNDHIASYCKKA